MYEIGLVVRRNTRTQVHVLPFEVVQGASLGLDMAKIKRKDVFTWQMGILL